MNQSIRIVIDVGAKIIEKHFIIDRAVGGPDSSFSMNENEFSEMVKSIREAEQAIGLVDYNLTSKQIKSKDFSRSLYIVKDIKEGDLITEENVRSIRPGFGLHPKFLNEILNMKFKKDIEKGTRVSFDLF